jgi:hypothetical protein
LSLTESDSERVNQASITVAKFISTKADDYSFELFVCRSIGRIARTCNGVKGNQSIRLEIINELEVQSQTHSGRVALSLFEYIDWFKANS